MNLLLKEYLSSGDSEEAVRCLRELEVPHFHHELVYEAVVLVLEDGREETARSICSLLRYMAVTTIITQDQLNTVSSMDVEWLKNHNTCSFTVGHEIC